MHPVVPVARLPPEILTLIFFILLSIAPPRRRQQKSLKYKHDLGWLNVTHVCQRWRNTALHEPLLWASDVAVPSRLGSHWADAFLSRAQDVPLTVTTCYETLPDYTFLRDNLARTRAILDLRISPLGLLALCIPAPLLHTLKFKCASNTQSKPEVRSVPKSLLGGAAGLPELRHLSVASWTDLSWARLLLEQLVSVDITVFFTYQMSEAKLTSMFAALSRMRGLERLVLQMELQKSKGPVPTTLLPALKCLTLEVTISDARTLLARLALPAGVRVHLTLKLGFGSPRVWMPTLFPAMIACVDARAAPIARVAVRRALPSRHSPFVDVRAWRTGDTDSVPNLAVRLQGWEDIPSVLGSLPSTHLEALTMGRDAPDAAWLDALGNASKLHRVTVKGGAVTPFCAALERAPGVLPALSTLLIYVQVHLSAKTVLGDLLPRGLAARASAGNLLQELEVVGCDEDEACTRALQEAVPGLLVRWCWESQAEAEDEEEEDKDEDDGNISDFYDTSPGEESDSDSISEESQY